MVLTSCKDFFADCKDFLSWSYRYELSQVDTFVQDILEFSRDNLSIGNIAVNNHLFISLLRF